MTVWSTERIAAFHEGAPIGMCSVCEGAHPLRPGGLRDDLLCSTCTNHVESSCELFETIRARGARFLAIRDSENVAVCGSFAEARSKADAMGGQAFDLALPSALDSFVSLTCKLWRDRARPMAVS